MRRNTSIELYRCLLMFGICFLHSVGLSTPLCKPVQSLLLPCVVGFVFVTGWFGIQFKISKVVRLVVTAWFCSLVVRTLDLVLLGGHGYPNGSFGLLSWARQWWFLNAYLMLMIIAPILNCIVDGLSSSSTYTRTSAVISCLGVLLCTFVLGFASHQFDVTLLPRNISLFFDEPCSFAVFAGIYVAARVCRTCNIIRRIGMPCSMYLFCAGVIGVLAGFRWHNSPFSLVMAATTFIAIKDIKLRPAVSRAVEMIAPSMFAVYLIHTHKKVGFVLIERYESYMSSMGLPLPIVWIVSSLTIFSIAIFLDVPRRVLMAFLKKPLKWILDHVDCFEECILNKCKVFVSDQS